MFTLVRTNHFILTWYWLLPGQVTDAQFVELGNRFKLSGGAINRAAYRAAACAALRPLAGQPGGGERVVNFADLERAAEVEKTKGEGDVTKSYQQQFL